MILFMFLKDFSGFSVEREFGCEKSRRKKEVLQMFR